MLSEAGWDFGTVIAPPVGVTLGDDYQEDSLTAERERFADIAIEGANERRMPSLIVSSSRNSSQADLLEVGTPPSPSPMKTESVQG